MFTASQPSLSTQDWTRQKRRIYASTFLGQQTVFSPTIPGPRFLLLHISIAIALAELHPRHGSRLRERAGTLGMILASAVRMCVCVCVCVVLRRCALRTDGIRKKRLGRLGDPYIWVFRFISNIYLECNGRYSTMHSIFIFSVIATFLCCCYNCSSE